MAEPSGDLRSRIEGAKDLNALLKVVKDISASSTHWGRRFKLSDDEHEQHGTVSISDIANRAMVLGDKATKEEDVKTYTELAHHITDLHSRGTATHKSMRETHWEKEDVSGFAWLKARLTSIGMQVYLFFAHTFNLKGVSQSDLDSFKNIADGHKIAKDILTEYKDAKGAKDVFDFIREKARKYQADNNGRPFPKEIIVQIIHAIPSQEFWLAGIDPSGGRNQINNVAKALLGLDPGVDPNREQVERILECQIHIQDIAGKLPWIGVQSQSTNALIRNLSLEQLKVLSNFCFARDINTLANPVEPGRQSNYKVRQLQIDARIAVLEAAARERGQKV